MALIQLSNGEKLNSGHVVKFEELHDGRFRFGMIDGSIYCGDVIDPEEAFFPIVPAAPGYQTVHTDIVESKRFWSLRAVVAWRLCPGGNYPLTVGRKEYLDSEYSAIVDPSGAVLDEEGNSYQSLEQFKAIIEEEDEGRSQKAA